MNKLIMSILLSIMIITLNAQEKGKIRLGADIGLGVLSDGWGFTGGLDLRYNIFDNFNAGVRFGSGLLIKDFSKSYVTTGLVANIILTSDYYFNNGSSSFAPFIGAGIGQFSNLNIYADANSQDELNWNKIPMDKSPGGVIRAGFELGKLRLSAEYYVIPSTTQYDKEMISTGLLSSNSFFNLSLGLYIGGGKWRKKEI